MASPAPVVLTTFPGIVFKYTDSFLFETYTPSAPRDISTYFTPVSKNFFEASSKLSSLYTFTPVRILVSSEFGVTP